MYPESSDGLNKETDSEIYFFTVAFEALNNFSAHSISIWGQTFATCEHAYQWKKFASTRPNIAKRIWKAGSPDAVKNISNTHKKDVAVDWQERKVQVMKEILEAKYAQHDDVREILQKTKNKTIIENSPWDSFWGNGPDNNGQNMLGKLWMEVRENKKFVN